MAKRSRKKPNIYNHKSSLNEFNRSVSKVENTSAAFRFSLEDKETLNDLERVNPNIMHSVLFSISKKDVGTARRFFINNVVRLYNMGVFNNSKVKSNYLSNKPESSAIELQKLIDRKYPNMSDEFHLNWVKVIFCLYYYFYDNPESIQINKKTTSIELMWFVFSLVLEKYASIEQTKQENQEEFEKYFTTWKNEHKTYKLLHNSIQTINEENKNEFIDIFNSTIEKWVSFEPDIFGLRNKKSEFLPFEDDFKKDKWEYLLKLSEKEESSYIKAVTLCDELHAVLKEKSVELADLFMYTCNFSVYYYDFIFEKLTNYLFSLFIRDINKENQKLRESEASLHAEQVKTLKGTNRNLTKNLKSIEYELNSVKNELGVLKAETEEVNKVMVDSDEINQLNLKIKELTDELDLKAEELNKVQIKSQWKENRILELEHNLSYFETVESDLLGLQNENNYIMNQISELERLENDEDDGLEFEKKLEAIKDEPILFVGGVGNMMSKFMEKFPNSDYIDISDMGVNFNVASRFKYVMIYTRVVTHSHCKRVESLVSKDKIIPLKIFNTKLVVEELYRRIIGHKNDN